MAPLLTALMAGRGWSPRASVFAGWYLLLAGTAAQVSRRLRRYRSVGS